MTQITGYQPPEFKERKPFFSRRTLWALNIILIPLIFVLSQLGQDYEEVAALKVEPATLLYSLSDTPFNRTKFDNLSINWVNLENSQMLYLGFVLNRQPISSESIPDHVELSTHKEGGKLWVQLKMPNNREVIFDALVFLRSWLPILGSDTPIMFAGELDEDIVGTIAENLLDNQGEFASVYLTPNKFVQAIESPQIGEQEFEVFYVVHLLIKSRVLSNRVQLSWDTQTNKRILGLNSVLQSNWLEPITRAEFDEVMGKIQVSLEYGELGQVSIVRYLMHQAGYNLPVDYFHTRSARYQQVSIERINKQLLKLQNEIKKPK